MKTFNSRKIIVLCGGILAATLAAGCYGGDSGYSNNPYGYGGGYGSSYSYNADNSGYYYPRNYNNAYSSGYQHGIRADENRDRYQERDTDRRVVTPERRGPTAVSRHSTIDRDHDGH